MSSLFVLLPTVPVTGSSEFAYVASSDGRSAGASGHAPASLLPATTGAGAELVAIVPSQALSWHRVTWPRGVAAQSPRLRAVLEGLLEDQLLDETPALHFAVEPGAKAGDEVWVAVCDRAWLRGALQALEAAGRPAHRVVPEVAPGAPVSVHAAGEPDRALWLARSEAGVSTLPLTAAALPLLPPLTDEALCFAEPALAAQAELLLHRPVVVQPAAQRWLQAAQSGWDLAQFDLASSGRARALKKFNTALGELLRAPHWRPLRWGLGLLLVANLAGLNLWAWRERTALEAKRDAVRTTLTQTFPQTRLVVDAPLQMEREVALLRQGAGVSSSRDLETLLGALASVAPDRSASSIEYAAGELRIRGLGWSAADVEAVLPRLRARGLSVRIQGDTVVLRPEGSA